MYLASTCKQTISVVSFGFQNSTYSFCRKKNALVFDLCLGYVRVLICERVVNLD